LKPTFDSEGPSDASVIPTLWCWRSGAHARTFAVNLDHRVGASTVISTRRYVEFEIGVSFDAEQTTVAVRGEVDLLTAPTLQAALTSLVDRGDSDIVLDLAALTFMDAAGLRVISYVSTCLAKSDGRLTVRSAPAMTRLILELSGLDKVVQLAASESIAVSALSAGRSAGSIRASRSNDDSIDAALRRVTELVDATVDGADGVSVTLHRNGRLSTVAATNDTVMSMDDHQYETGEGPCLSAAAKGRWFEIESLADEARWPAFVPRALEQGIASILSTPLMTAERPLGALNIYSNTERAFGAHERDLARLFAAQAAGILADAGADAPDEELDKRISDALIARQTIARAQGVLMERDHISADNAAAEIHRSARAARVAVARHAGAIVDSTHDASDSAA
jgi:anti-anti-sigma factor